MIVQRGQWQEDKTSLTGRRDWAGSGRLMSDDLSKRMAWCFPFTQHGEKNDGPMSKVSIRIIDWFSRKRTCLSDSVRESQRLVKYCAEEMTDSLMTFIKSPPSNYSSCPIAWVCGCCIDVSNSNHDGLGRIALFHIRQPAMIDWRMHRPYWINWTRQATSRFDRSIADGWFRWWMGSDGSNVWDENCICDPSSISYRPQR